MDSPHGPSQDRITSIEQLANGLVEIRERHAAELSAFMNRIDPDIMLTYDPERLMEPMVLSLIEKQQQTHHLMSMLGVRIPSSNQQGDEIILGLQREWLTKTETKRTKKVNELKETMGIVSSPETAQTDTASSKPGPHRWTGKELGILHSFYPLLSLDYEAYGTILPGISPDMVKRKIDAEIRLGTLEKREWRQVYKPASSATKLLTHAKLRRTPERASSIEKYENKRRRTSRNLREAKVEVEKAVEREEENDEENDKEEDVDADVGADVDVEDG